LFSHISARAIEAVCLLTIDSLDLETLMKSSHDAASSTAVAAVFFLIRRSPLFIGTNQAGIAGPFRRMNRCVGNLPPWIKAVNCQGR
jgi:hypothetical protein